MMSVKDILILPWCCYTNACATIDRDRSIVSRAGPFSWWDVANIRGKAIEPVLLLN